MVVETQAFARAGLLGNPSDGYFGKIIAISVRNFSARVILEETKELKIFASTQDESVYRGIHDLVERTRLFGYYGGVRLIKAAVKKFDDHCRSCGIDLERRNFSVRYETSIPRQLGLGGSSGCGGGEDPPADEPVPHTGGTGGGGAATGAGGTGASGGTGGTAGSGGSGGSGACPHDGQLGDDCADDCDCAVDHACLCRPCLVPWRNFDTAARPFTIIQTMGFHKCRRMGMRSSGTPVLPPRWQNCNTNFNS